MPETLITKFTIRAVIRTFNSCKVTNKCKERNKEKIKEPVINTRSQQKIIHRGAKFFIKGLSIGINLVFYKAIVLLQGCFY